MSEQPAPEDPDALLKNRLSALDARLNSQHKEATENGLSVGGTTLDGRAIKASRIGTELLVAICAGVGIGWLLDRLFDTLPLFMLVLAFVGFGAGILNVWRLVNGRYGSVGFKDEKNE